MLTRIKAPLKKVFFHHIWALVGRGKLSSMIRHGLVALFQDWVTLFKDFGSILLVECSLNAALVQLSMAQRGHVLLVYHLLVHIKNGPIQLLIALSVIRF